MHVHYYASRIIYVCMLLLSYASLYPVLCHLSVIIILVQFWRWLSLTLYLSNFPDDPSQCNTLSGQWFNSTTTALCFLCIHVGIKQALAFRSTILCQDHANVIIIWLNVDIDGNPFYIIIGTTNSHHAVTQLINNTYLLLFTSPIIWVRKINMDKLCSKLRE